MLASPVSGLVTHPAKRSSSAIGVRRGQPRLKMRMDKNSKSFSYMLLASPLMKAKGFYRLLCLSLYQSHCMFCSLRCHIFGRPCYHPNTEESRAERCPEGPVWKSPSPSLIVGAGINMGLWLRLLPAPSLWANSHYTAFWKSMSNIAEHSVASQTKQESKKWTYLNKRNVV